MANADFTATPDEHAATTANNLGDTVKLEIENQYALISDQLDAAKAICDAVAILFALERAPEHQDSHPSHNIRTGGGYAHGLRVCHDTVPALLRHAFSLIDMADNDADCMREHALNAILEANHAKH